jgi:hypothetical protein
LRKDKESERAGLKRLLKSNQRKKGGKAVTEEQSENNKYVIVATSLGKGVTAARVLELYQARWQIEIAFKRLKSLFHYNDLPAKNGESARAWFYGKLLLAALCETMVNTGRFPPQKQRCRGKRLPQYERLSLWRELRVALTLIAAMLLSEINYSDLSGQLNRLSSACADSKRKRLPQLCFFSSA